MLTSSKNGEIFQSKGYHAMNIISWFDTMRNVDWMKWNNKSVIAAHVVYFLISGIHPAAVSCPVSASLVGRSSHVKLSVRSIARSILRCWSLRQRNQTTISKSLNVKKKIIYDYLLLSSYAQWITWPRDSEIHSVLCTIVTENSLSVLKFSYFMCSISVH